jgi:hypothetical protein
MIDMLVSSKNNSSSGESPCTTFTDSQSVSDAVERLPNALRLPSSWLYETGCDLLEVTSRF